MPISHTLVPNTLVTSDNISVMTVILSELSDGNDQTGMICDPAQGFLICRMSDLASQPTNGSLVKLNVKSLVASKATVDIRVSYDGNTYIQIANYTIAGDNDSSFQFATYNASSENANTSQLNAEQVNNMQLLIQLSGGRIHDLNVTIGTEAGRVQIPEGRVFFRDGRVRI